MKTMINRGASSSQKNSERPHSVSLEKAKYICIQTLVYLSNHLIAKIPIPEVRHLWYRKVLGLTMGKGSLIRLDTRILIRGLSKKRNCTITIGNNSIVNEWCLLDASGGITIGDNVSISSHVFILTGQHDINDTEFLGEFAPVTIEDRVFIGTRAMVLPGVRIGEGAVISAGAVVSRSVPPFTIMAGVPARKVGERSRELEYALDYHPFLG